MRQVTMIIIVYFFVAIIALSLVYGADLTINWDPSDRAAGYRLYQSVDLGTIWTDTDVQNVTSYKPLNLPDSGLVLFKVRAYNANGDSDDSGRGAWWNGDWTPPDTTLGVGLE